MEQNKTLTLDEQFNKDCEIVNLRYEYPGYTGTEKYGIITSLSEKELDRKYAGCLANYIPFIVLDPSFGKIRKKFISNENKHRMRAARTVEPFDYDDELLSAYHPELIQNSFEAECLFHMECSSLQKALDALNPTQRARVVKFFFMRKSKAEIASEEGVSYQAIQSSIEHALKKLKIFLENRLVD